MARNGVKTGGGSRKGKPNKLTKIQRDELVKYCEETGANPFKFWADVLNNTVDVKTILVGIKAGLTEKQAYEKALEAQANMKHQAARSLAPYLLPQLKQTEVELGEKTRKAIRFIYGKD